MKDRHRLKDNYKSAMNSLKLLQESWILCFSTLININEKGYHFRENEAWPFKFNFNNTLPSIQ